MYKCVYLNKCLHMASCNGLVFHLQFITTLVFPGQALDSSNRNLVITWVLKWKWINEQFNAQRFCFQLKSRTLLNSLGNLVARQRPTSKSTMCMFIWKLCFNLFSVCIFLLFVLSQKLQHCMCSLSRKAFCKCTKYYN